MRCSRRRPERLPAPDCSRSRRCSDAMPEPYQSARALSDAIRSGSLSAEEACRTALDRIQAVNGSLAAFRLVDGDRALARARELDRQGRSAGPLHGIPIAIKDNIASTGVTTTAGSKILEHYVSPF